MLPIYLTYFAGQETKDRPYVAMRNALGFVLGFTALFMLLGAFSAQLGALFRVHSMAVNLICGAVMILFGLNFMEWIRIPLINQTKRVGEKRNITGFWSAVLFGIVFSISWTPCVGTFLGAALLLAAQAEGALKGMLMLLSFSLGLGIPFLLSAVLIDKLKRAFLFIKRNYRVINTVSGLLLVLLGILVATGMLSILYALI
jgi:cytochrome c-type biogenesis protein